MCLKEHIHRRWVLRLFGHIKSFQRVAEGFEQLGAVSHILHKTPVWHLKTRRDWYDSGLSSRFRAKYNKSKSNARDMIVSATNGQKIKL